MQTKSRADFVEPELPRLKTNLYGLDFIIDQSGRCVLNEINGVKSGMYGFRQVYGDDRVKDEVFHRLSRVKRLTINNGQYNHDRRKKAIGGPFKTCLYGLAFRFAQCVSPGFFPRSSDIISPDGEVGPAVHKHIITEKGHYDWLFEKDKTGMPPEQKFDVYNGQDSLVLNYVNEVLPHPTVNSFVCEDLAESKFLQYLILKDTPLVSLLPKTTIVGLGVAETKTLESMVKSSRSLVQKPVIGKCGRGFRMIGKKDVEKYIRQKGPLTDKRSPFHEDFSFFGLYSPLSVGDLILKDDFCFESGMSVVQTFIDSRRGGENYSCIRAIVCNGDFIDAYLRYDSNPRVNLSQGAKAAPFYRRGFDRLCENLVKIYEDKCSSLHPYDFKRDLYMRWLYDYDEKLKKNLMLGTIEDLASLLSTMHKTG